MYYLSREKRIQVLSLLLEGNSIRAINRLTGVALDTIQNLLKVAGKVALEYHDQKVRNIHARYIQCDEIWSYIFAKNKTVINKDLNNKYNKNIGDIWVWTCIDADSKLIISYLTGPRSTDYAHKFMNDVAKRLSSKVQLTTDGLLAYIEAVEEAFGGDVDYAQEKEGNIKEIIAGDPDIDHISTSYVERQNLTMRTNMRRFMRRTNGFSKSLQNHIYMVALYFLYYNFIRIHSTLQITPAMAAGLTSSLYGFGWLVDLITAASPKPGKRGHYRPRQSHTAA